MTEPRALRDLAMSVAAEAFALAARMRDQGVDVAATKSSLTDVVTKADEATQALIRRRLLHARPEDGFLGEEGDDVSGSSGIRWVVDPIDGTVNYFYGIDQWAVSIAAETSDEVVAGVVYAGKDRVYHAYRGGGAFRGDRTLRVRESVEMGQRLILTGFTYDLQLRRQQGGYVAALVGHVRDVRRMGSAALDLCMVAEGQADGYVEECTHHWDRAAAGLIAAEAGAEFEVRTSPSGHDLVVCSPSAGHRDFVNVVRQCGFLAP